MPVPWDLALENDLVVCFDQVQQFLYGKGFAQHVYAWEAGAYLFELAFTRGGYDDDWEGLRGDSAVEVVDDCRTGQHAWKQEVNNHQVVRRWFVLVSSPEGVFYSSPGATIADGLAKVHVARTYWYCAACIKLISLVVPPPAR